MTAITHPGMIEAMRLLTLRSALKLEMAGMKRSGRGPTAYSILKQNGYKGTRAQVLEQLNQERKEILGGRVEAVL